MTLQIAWQACYTFREVDLYPITNILISSIADSVQRLHAPEYANYVHVSVNGDIFIYGVLIVEIVSCKRNSE